MREQDWLTSDTPEAMFAFLAGRGEPRRWRLFTSACLRELGHLLPCPRARSAFLAVEQAAEREAPPQGLATAHAQARASYHFLRGPDFPRDVDRHVRARMAGVSQALLHATLPDREPEAQAFLVSTALRYADMHDPSWERRVRSLCCDLLRDLFGNPYRPIDLPEKWLRDRGGEASVIARTIYDDRSFDELPILADALEDAGCPAGELIRHCRQPGPHGRGCWAVDLLAEAG